jgi:hypothetical protein
MATASAQYGPGVFADAVVDVPPLAPGPGGPVFLPDARGYMPATTTAYNAPMRAKSPSPRRGLAAVIVAALVVLLLIVAVIIWRGATSLSSRLARAGWVLYAKEGCGFCDEQLAMFGKKLPKLLVYCYSDGTAMRTFDAPPVACNQLHAFPTWYNRKTSETRVGLQKPRDLAQMAGM